MIKNISIYLGVLIALFLFSAFHRFEYTTWVIFVFAAIIPVASAVCSLPFMIVSALRGLSVTAPDRVKMGENVVLSFGSVGGKKLVLPQLKIKIVAANDFAGIHRTVKIKTGGVISQPLLKESNDLAAHCGTVSLKLKYCRVYDLMGFFFIPAKLFAVNQICVMPLPKEPAVLPEAERVRVLGFKPKSGGGFSDFYELRTYQNGDSIKSIHWKISSKTDNLIVREPSLPVTRKLMIKPELSSDSDVNDSVLCRVACAAEHLLAQGRTVYCLDAMGGAHQIDDKESYANYFESVYNGVKGREYDVLQTEFYVVSESGEEVRGL